jgi:hypothetical protein
MGNTEYQWRLRRLEEAVPKALRAMKRGPVATALSRALGHYRWAGQLVERGMAATQDRPIGSAEDRAAALQAVWRCASDQITAAEALISAPGFGPWAERVQAPARPRP